MPFPRTRRTKKALGALFLFLVIYITYKVFQGSGQTQYLLLPTEDPNEERISEDDFRDGVIHHEDEKNLELELISQVLSEVQNLPNDPQFLLGGQPDGPSFYKKPNCARFPHLYKIQFSNLYWQVQKIRNATFYLYNAYYDNRKPNQNAPLIRILAMVDQRELMEPAFCQLWFKNEHDPVFSGVIIYRNIWQGHWSRRGFYTAFLIACQIPQSHVNKVPESVSLVKGACDSATNNLHVYHDLTEVDAEDKKNRFGVCVKGLDLLHDDKSIRLIEWIELLNILGADKIFFYEFTVHPNVKKVLEYYSKQGKIQVTPLTLPGTLPNEPRLRHLFLGTKEHLINKRKNEVIPYNDCLYRNLNKYEFLAVLDTDEVIIPKIGVSWKDLTNDPVVLSQKSQNLTDGKPISTYCFRNSYFFDGLTENRKEEELSEVDGTPNYLHMLKHIYRSTSYTPPKKFIKCFHGTDRTFIIHNHFPFGCLGGSCTIHHFDTNSAHLQHYRSTCVNDLGNCTDYEQSSVRDTTIWRYKDELISRVSNAIFDLGLKGDTLPNL